MLASVVLYILGVPLWMILGMLLLVFLNRRRVKKQPGTFPVKVRVEAETEAEEVAKWPRQISYAQWVHDVLIVRKGLGMMQTIPYGVSEVLGPAEDTAPEELKGLGDHPTIMRTRLDDGSLLQIAVEELHPEFAPDRFVQTDAQQ